MIESMEISIHLNIWILWTQGLQRPKKAKVTDLFSRPTPLHDHATSRLVIKEFANLSLFASMMWHSKPTLAWNVLQALLPTSSTNETEENTLKSKVWSRGEKMGPPCWRKKCRHQNNIIVVHAPLTSVFEFGACCSLSHS